MDQDSKPGTRYLGAQELGAQTVPVTNCPALLHNKGPNPQRKAADLPGRPNKRSVSRSWGQQHASLPSAWHCAQLGRCGHSSHSSPRRAASSRPLAISVSRNSWKRHEFPTEAASASDLRGPPENNKTFSS